MHKKRFVILSGFRYQQRPKREAIEWEMRSYYKLIEVYKVRDKGNKQIFNLGDTIVKFANDTEFTSELLPDSAPDSFHQKFNNIFVTDDSEKLDEDEMEELLKHWVSQLVAEEGYEMIGFVQKEHLSYGSEPKVLRIPKENVRQT